jgi:virulence-associated protein VagC
MKSTASAPSAPLTVRVFTNGGSQAVTIPRQYRLTTKRATVSRKGDTLIIKPAKDAGSWDDLWDDLKPLDSSFRRWPTGPAEVREAL